MYRTKEHIDKHVSNILGQIRDERERNTRGFQFARLYFEIKEYDIAIRYLAGFLSVRQRYAPAFKLQGQIYEGKQAYPKALESYKKSLEIDDKQKDVLLKICNILCDTEIDPDRAKYWADRAEKVHPSNEIVLRLKESICNRKDTGGSKEELEDLLAKELEKNPKNVKMRIKLLKLYVDTERVNEAYTHAAEVEKRLPHTEDIDWYRNLLDVFEAYRSDSGANVNGDFHRMFLGVLNQLVTLSLEIDPIAKTVEILHRFDQILFSAEKQGLASEDWKVFYSEMQAQLFFQTGNLLLKKAQQNRMTWPEVANLAGACYLASASFDTPNMQASWYIKATDLEKKTYDWWNKLACHRASQVGYLLRKWSGSDAAAWIRKVQDNYCNSQGKDKIFQALFTQRGMKETKEKSYIVQNAVFTTFKPEIPGAASLQDYVIEAHLKRPDDFHFLVWLSLQQYTDIALPHPEYKYAIFNDLQYGAINLDTSTPETLTQLDTEAFLIATVVSAANRMAEEQAENPAPVGSLTDLPASLCYKLCTKQQQEWWTAAYQLYSNTARDSLGLSRRVLQRGLEVIRLIGHHSVGMDVVVHMARTFAHRMQTLKAESLNGLEYMDEINALQARALCYWKAAVSGLQRAIKSQPLRPLKESLFPSRDGKLPVTDMEAWLKEGQLFLAKQDMDDGKYESALSNLGKVDTPEASFYQAQIYKTLANDETGTSTLETSTVGLRGKISALLSKSRDSLYLTLDRLRGDRKHDLNSSVAEELDEVESKINRLEVGQGDTDSDPGPSVSSLQISVQETPRKNVTFGESFIHSTPARLDNLSLDVNIGSAIGNSPQSRLRPSPERLDAQLRSLAHSQDNIVKTLVEELRESRKTIQKLQERVAELEATQKVYLEQLAAGKLQAAQVAAPPPGAIPATLTPAGLAAPHLAGHPRPPLPRHPGYYTASPIEYLSPQGYAAYAYTGIPGLAPAAPAPAPAAMPSIPAGYYQQQSSVGPTRQSHRQTAQLDADEEDYEDYYPVDDDEDEVVDGATAAVVGKPGEVPDSQLVQEWPYGNAVAAEGKGTLTYAPQPGKPVPRGPGGYLPQLGSPAIYSSPAAIPGMPGPGYFSSPEQSSTPRFPAPQNGQSSLITVAPADNGTTGGQTQPAGASPGTIATNFPMSMPSVTAEQKTGTPLTVTAPAQKAASPAQTSRPETDGDGFVAGEDGPGHNAPEFEPIVQLPEKVDLTTGEEGYTELFSFRAKLFRFTDKQWKERGIGQIKILHKEETGVVRVVMRREQVHKVCANHFIKPDTEIDFKDKDGTSKDDKVLTWKAVDYSDEEPRLEQFACKFKAPETAAEFKEKFEAAVEIAKRAEKADHVATEGKSSDAPAVTAPSGTPAADLLKSMAANIGKEAPATGQTFGGFSFTTKPVVKEPEPPSQTLAQAPAPAAGKDTKTPPKVNPFASFSFGSTASPAASQTGTTSSSGTTSLFGGFSSSSSGAPSFASLAASSDSKPTFGGTKPAEAQGFSPKPVFGSPAVTTPAKGGGDDDHVTEEYEPDVTFEPVVTLPDNVEVKTGEEDEEKLFGARAKLFRHDTDAKAWKDRGIGEIKIMANKKSVKFRIVMRREQVHKVCANHYITKAMELKQMGSANNAFCYLANDFAEEEAKTEFLAVKFKNGDIASNFKDVFTECQAKMREGDGAKSEDGDGAKSEKVEESKTAVTSSTDQKEAAGTSGGSLSGMFQAKGGEWDCTACYVRNKGDVTQCVACAAAKPGTEPPAPAKPPVPAVPVIPTGGNSLAGMFQAKGGEWDCTACYVRNKGDVRTCVACSAVKPGCEPEQEQSVTSTDPGVTFTRSAGGGFKFGGVGPISTATFGSPASSTQPAGASTAPLSGGFSFGGTTSKADSTVKTEESKPSGGFAFGQSTTGGGFSFGKPQEPAVSTTTEPAESTTPSVGGFKFGTEQPTSTTPAKPAGGFTFGSSGGFAFGSGSTETKPEGDVSSSVPDSTVTSTDKAPGSKFGSSTFNFTLTPGSTPQKQTAPKSPQTPQSPEGDYYVNKEGEDDHIYFEPVVKLPDNVEVKTGEEDEEVLYCHRAKLFRFDNKEWKERGLGDIKILRNKSSQKVRMLMRREKVLKICLNHLVTGDMSLEPMPNNPGKTWTWHAMDAADDEPKHESFAIRFKTEDIANDFKAAFNAARDGQEVPEPSAAEPETKKEETPKKSDTFSFSSPDGKKDSGAAGFTFGGTQVSSGSSGFTFGGSSAFGSLGAGGSVFGGGSPSTGGAQKFTFGQATTVLAKSDTTKPAVSPGGSILAKLLTGEQTAEDLSASSDVEILKVVMPTQDKIELARKFLLPDTFFNYELQTCPGCIGCDDDNFDFSSIGKRKTGDDALDLSKTSAEPATTDQPDSTTAGASVFGGSQSSGFDFASLASNTSGSGFGFGQKQDASQPFSWQGAGASVFGKTEQGEGDDDEVAPSDDIHFEPIVQLPEVVDLKTGEEDDEEMFRQRSKLYRFDPGSKAWKERGLGEMKILKNINTGRYRFLMRREQVFKIACNHALTPDLKVEPLATSETSWCWTAMDYAEGEPKLEQFALKFKNKDIAQTFKDAVDKCQEDMRANPSPIKPKVPAAQESGEQNSFVNNNDEAAAAREEEEEEDDDEDEYEDEEDDPPLFAKRATLYLLNPNGEFAPQGMGELNIYLDNDVIGYRVMMDSDQGITLCNHIICRTYTLEKNAKKRNCEWTAVDFSTDEPVKRTFRVQFSSGQVADEFETHFNDGLQLAIESEIDPMEEGTSAQTREISFEEAARAGQRKTQAE